MTNKINTTKNIMIVGVGGQGTLLASKVLGKLLVNRGMDVKVSEVHGMSQRGGSVVTYVRFGEKVYSPIIDVGEADFILAFELLEAARWSRWLKPGGRLIANTRKIDPMPVITGATSYPEGIEEEFLKEGFNFDGFDALSLAMEAGSPKAVNMVLLGRLSWYFDFTDEEVFSVLEETVPKAFLELNRRAYTLGKKNYGKVF